MHNAFIYLFLNKRDSCSSKKSPHFLKTSSFKFNLIPTSNTPYINLHRKPFLQEDYIPIRSVIHLRHNRSVSPHPHSPKTPFQHHYVIPTTNRTNTNRLTISRHPGRSPEKSKSSPGGPCIHALQFRFIRSGREEDQLTRRITD